jgi:hypothetical protein
MAIVAIAATARSAIAGCATATATAGTTVDHGSAERTVVPDGEMTADESLDFGSPVPRAGLDGGALRSSAETSGEHRLILAILEDAIALLVRSVRGGAVEASEARAARAWLAGRDRRLPFTFEHVCDLLGFDSDHIRRGPWSLHAMPIGANRAIRRSGRRAEWSTARSRTRC